MKIVTLLPAATEIVAALGLEENLVGQSHECDYPPSILDRLPCTQTKFQAKGNSLEIDNQIKHLVKEGLSIYQVLEERLRQLQPDLVITQTQCEVCAVSEKEVEKALCHWLAARPQLVSLNPTHLSAVWEDIRKIGTASNTSEKAEGFIRELQERLSDISQKTKKASLHPTVACIEWIEPLMCAGNWVPELVELAGGIDVFGVVGEHSPYLAWENLVKQNPDLLVLMPCGWDIKKCEEEMAFLTQKKEWAELKAVKNKKVYLTDGNQFFNRPGPRLVESTEILAEIFHPQLFENKWEGKGWKNFF